MFFYVTKLILIGTKILDIHQAQGWPIEDPLNKGLK